MSNRLKGTMTAKKATRVEQLENLLDLVVRDMNQFQQHVNYLGRILQATVNVLGQGPVTAEVERLAKEANTPPPPSVAEQAIAAEQGIDANGSPVEEASGDAPQDRPAESP